MSKVIMWIMAICALIGGLDRICGNKFHLGDKFEHGFELMGATALSMVGILCLVPLISALIQKAIVPICIPLGLDPAIFGGILAIDMGGYQLSKDLALDPNIANFSGVIIASILGCTICFTIPIGMGILNDDAKADFASGILFGLISIPFALLIGGLLCRLQLSIVLMQSIPCLIFSLLIMLAMRHCPDRIIHIFTYSSSFLKLISTVGLMLGAFKYMTGLPLFPWLTPIEEAMSVVASIAIVMLGSLPFAELLQRLLKRPLEQFGRLIHINNVSVAGLLIGMVSVLPAIALIKDMDKRGRVLNAAFMVCAASAFAAHLGFIASIDAGQILPLLCSKLLGGCFGVLIALFATRDHKTTRQFL